MKSIFNRFVTLLERSLALLLLSLVAGLVTIEAQSPGMFSSTGDLIKPRYAHTATLLNDGRVLITGGVSSPTGDLGNSTSEASAEIYDPATGRFRLTGSMATARSFHTATLLPDGTVLVTGGFATPEVYDPATGTFHVTGAMKAPRYGSSAILLVNGKVLIAGGITDFLSSPTTSAELYDPAIGSFISAGDMASPQFAPLVANLPDGKVLLIDGGSDYWAYASSQIYDPVSGSFSTIEPWIPFDGGSATLLPNGQVLVAGGDPASFGSTDAALYDPAARVFHPTGPTTRDYVLQVATGLSDGDVLLVGGWCSACRTPLGGYNNDARVDLYDPTTGRFSATGSMTTGRESPSVTLLSNGQVLVTGGDEFWAAGAGVRDISDHPIKASAELYTPASITPPPMIFSVSDDGKGQGAILHANTPNLASPDNPAVEGEALEVYCTGLMDGAVVPPQVSIGGRLAEVLYFGNAPGWPGLDQIDVRVPAGAAAGPAVPVRINYLGRPSNEVTIAVQ